MEFETKDSGQRVDFDSGMRRDVNTGKPRYDLIPPAMLKRLAELYARGAEKYTARNWEQANSQEELDRFKESAWRHFMQWNMGELDEDHLIATVWNLFAYETIREKLDNEKDTTTDNSTTV